MPIFILAGGLFVLAVVSGMLGLGVAFAAVPFLGLFLPDLVHQVQPAQPGAQRGHDAVLDLRLRPQRSRDLEPSDRARRDQHLNGTILSSTSGTFTSPPSLAYRLLRPGEDKEGEAQETARGNLKAALILAVPIPILSGLLGVGPGFL